MNNAIKNYNKKIQDQKKIDKHLLERDEIDFSP